ncbi:hypothetical protein WESB_0325 [Brachyspira pilosicoli WesB]|uniref:Mor transcription activator domain-containing protein n=1 Tax=Brachyspira pilosicoli WesB TaxID=1161918 RepID=K0JI80_BRAPL|nr:hypothetical protein [Brachyspira pilosicoli]CCG55796.1 hypothetical protein WESB_0325 [Brachyspira pilosicoli WesB]
MNNDFIGTIKEALLEAGISKELTIKALRAFCRKYGGQKVYFSCSAESKRSSEIFNLIYNELGEEREEVTLGTSEKITRIFLENFYNISEYVPQEIKTFRREIALEILKEYKESKDKNKTQIEICQKYNITFVTFLKLRKEAQKKILKEQQNNLNI